MEAEKRKRLGTSKFTIMKNYLSLLILVLPLLFSLNELYADNSVVVTVPTTQNYSNYLPPLKPGASYSFQISAKNNLSDSCSLTLDADQFGFVRSWITITTNPITIGAGQTNYLSQQL